MQWGGALLAAGASRRFGTADKLTAPLRGRRLGEHAAAALAGAGLAPLWAIAASPVHPCAPVWEGHGFEVAINPRAGEGMGTSVALAAYLARAAGCAGLIIALADMPGVPTAHFAALARRLAESGPEAIVTSALGDARLPPAGFGAARLAELEALRGDQGARALLAEGEIVQCPPEWLGDIDTPGDLARWR